MISGKSAKIIKKGLLFILYGSEEKGWLACMTNFVRACMMRKKKYKTWKQSIDTNGHRRADEVGIAQRIHYAFQRLLLNQFRGRIFPLFFPLEKKI